MIKINLYPYKKRRREFSIELEFGIYIFVLLLVAILLFFINTNINAHIDELTKIKAQKQSLHRILIRKVKIVNNYKNQLKLLSHKIRVIKEIRKNQNMPVIYLNELVRNFIKDKLWFTSLNLSSSGNIDISGVALDNQVLAQYIKRLRSSKYTKEVYLKKSAKKKIMGYDLVSFSFRIQTQKNMDERPK